jgi:hypothetical protein
MLVLLAGLAGDVRAQSGLSIWGGAGTSTRGGAEGRWSSQLGIQLAVPVVPIAARADLLALGNNFAPDRLSFNVNAVARLPLPLVQPYVIVGRGTYKQDPDLTSTGWNTGAGVRVGLGRAGVFAEMRRHHPVRRTITTVGVTF